MSIFIDMTGGPVRVTSSQKQDLRNALDVSSVSQLDMLLAAMALEGTNSPTATVKISTGMQKSTEDGWVTVITFTQITGSNVPELKQSLSFLRYIRWEVTLTGTTPALTFGLSGIGRGD